MHPHLSQLEMGPEADPSLGFSMGGYGLCIHRVSVSGGEARAVSPGQGRAVSSQQHLTQKGPGPVLSLQPSPVAPGLRQMQERWQSSGQGDKLYQPTSFAGNRQSQLSNRCCFKSTHTTRLPGQVWVFHHAVVPAAAEGGGGHALKGGMNEDPQEEPASP